MVKQYVLITGLCVIGCSTLSAQDSYYNRFSNWWQSKKLSMQQNLASQPSLTQQQHLPSGSKYPLLARWLTQPRRDYVMEQLPQYTELPDTEIPRELANVTRQFNKVKDDWLVAQSYKDKLATQKQLLEEQAKSQWKTKIDQQRASILKPIERRERSWPAFYNYQ